VENRISRKSLLLYFGITFIVIIIDQISKLLIQSYLSENQSVSVIGDLVNFHFIYNMGGALGTSIGPTWIYSILTIGAIFLIIKYFTSPESDGALSRISLSLILGGAAGNLIDRIRMGRVVDFIDVGIPHNLRFRWFVFNVADAAITIGLILFAFSILFHKKTVDDGSSNLPEPHAPEIESDPSKA
jgi:signal peptidase II